MALDRVRIGWPVAQNGGEMQIQSPQSECGEQWWKDKSLAKANSIGTSLLGRFGCAWDLFTEILLNHDPNLGELGPEIGGLRAMCTLFRSLQVPYNIDYVYCLMFYWTYADGRACPLV